MANNRIDRTPHYNFAIFDKSQIGIFFDDFVKYLAGTNNSNMNSIDDILYDFEQQMANVKDGDSAYVHIRWGSSLTPEELLEIPADYIGIYSGDSPTPPTNHTGYKWYKYKGENGLSAYLHIKWGDSTTPEVLLDSPADYIGFCASSSSNAPTDYTEYKWYYYKGEKGEKGNVMYATFSFDPNTGNLIMHTPDEYTGATFSINENGELVVEIEVS